MKTTLTPERDGRGLHPNSRANLRLFTRENAREMQARGVSVKLRRGELEEIASKAFDDEEICVKLARYTNAKIMADEGLPPLTRLEASAPFLKRASGNVAVQVNIAAPLDKVAEQVIGSAAPEPPVEIDGQTLDRQQGRDIPAPSGTDARNAP